MSRSTVMILSAAVLTTILFGEYSAVPLLLLSIYQIYRLLPSEFSPLQRVFMIGPLLTTLTVLIASFAIPSQRSFSSEYVLLALFCVLLTLERFKEQSKFSFSFVDGAAIAVFLCGCAMHLPSLLSFESGMYLPVPSRGEDAISHLSIYFLIIKEEGLLFFRNHLTPRVLTGLLHYPQAFHYGSALLYDTFTSIIPMRSLPHSISFFVLSFIGWSASLSALLVYGAASALSSYRVRWNGITLIAGFIAIFVSGWISVYLTLFSFYSQVAALTLFSIFLVLLSHSSRRSYLWALISEIGIAASWYFLTPVSTALLFATMLRDRALFSKREWAILWAVSLCTKGFFIWVSLAGIETHNALVQPGGILLPPSWIFWFFGTAGICVYLVAWKNNKSKPIYIYAAAVVLSAAFSGFVYAYQVLSTGQLSYYFYKSLYTIVIPSVVLCAVGMTALLVGIEKYVLKKYPRYERIVGTICAAALLGLCVEESLYHFKGYLADRIHFIPRAAYGEMIRLSRHPQISQMPIYTFTDNHIEAYIQDRLIPIIVGSAYSVERMHTPLEVMSTGEPYAVWLYRYLSTRSEPEEAIVFDIKKRLRNRCAREFFKLQEKGRIQIVPKEAAVWRVDKCGSL